MISYILLFCLTFGFANVESEIIETIEVINNSTQVVNVQHTLPVPEYTKMLITIKLIELRPLPKAHIISWVPASYGNYPGIGYQKPPLPIYVRIGFDQEVTDSYVNDFFRLLNNSRPVRHGLGGHVVTVPRSTNREEFQLLLDRISSNLKHTPQG